jgi:hypothetical protein
MLANCDLNHPLALPLPPAIAVLWGAKSKWDIANDSEANLLTIALAILRGVGQEDDPYKAGTLRERAYIRSLHFDRLAKQANVDLLDNEIAEEEALDAAIQAGEFD